MITADLIRQLIADHDAARPRSKQTAIGPSDLSGPCSRKLVYQLLGVPKVVDDTVNLQAWVGTSIHAQMEQVLDGSPDWVTEQTVSVEVAKGIVIGGSLDAYHKPSKTIVDWKSVGPSALAKYRQRSPDNYLDQVAIYGLLAVLSGRMQVENTAIVYLPRNGSMSDIHADVHPWDEDRADAAIRRLEALHAAAAAGPAVLPLIPTGDACRFCGWWSPNSDRPEIRCPGVNPQPPELPSWEG